MLYSWASCDVVNHLEKIKSLILSGKKSIRHHLTGSAVSTERANSLSHNSECRQHTALLPASKDQFAANARTSMLSTGKLSTICVLKRFGGVFQRLWDLPFCSSLRESSGMLHLLCTRHPWSNIRVVRLHTQAIINVNVTACVYTGRSLCVHSLKNPL